MAARGENPPWTLREVFLLAALSVTVVAIILFMAIGIAKHFHPTATVSGLGKNPKVIIPAQFVAYIFILLGMITFLRSRGLRFWNNIRWQWPSAWILFPLAGVVLSVGVQLLSALLPIPRQLPIDQYFSDTGGAYLMAIFGLTMAPLLEELFFRGFFYPALARPIGVTGAVIVTSILFAFTHASQLASAWGPLVLLFTVSIALTITRIRTGSVAASFLVHVGYNSTLFVIMWIATDHFRHLEKMR